MTPSSPLDIRRVGKEAAPQVNELCRDAALWLKAKGIDQWQSVFDPQKRQATMERRFKEGEVYLAYLDGLAVATITLQWQDPFWGELGLDPKAGYIHMLAVRRDHAGRGLGKALLDWTGDYFAKAGRMTIRLDCIEENTRLCRLYDEQGFKTVGRKDWDGEHLVMKEKIKPATAL